MGRKKKPDPKENISHILLIEDRCWVNSNGADSESFILIERKKFEELAEKNNTFINDSIKKEGKININFSGSIETLNSLEEYWDDINIVEIDKNQASTILEVFNNFKGYYDDVEIIRFGANSYFFPIL